MNLNPKRPPVGGAEPGVRVPNYELIRCLAVGAFGRVWLARNVCGSFHAVKIVERDRLQTDRQYEREFEGVRLFDRVTLRHPALVQVLHVGRDDRQRLFYYVMELADDPATGHEVRPISYRPHTLRSELDACRRLPVADCARLALPLLSALDHLHQAGLVHRDIKPANFIVVRGRPKVADIGLVAEIGEHQTIIGTVGYLAPEGPGRPSADIFSFGRMLFEMFTGVEVMRCGDVLPDAAPRFPDERDQRFLGVILKACQARPERRWPGAAEFYDAVAPFLPPEEDSAAFSGEFDPLQQARARARPAPPAAVLEPSGGAVPLKSRFYIERAGDHVLEVALARGDGLVRVRGARQSGKTSLLARGLRQARQAGRRAVLSDLQKANTASLASAEALLLFLGESLAEQLALEVLPEDHWDGRRSASSNFGRYLEQVVLPVGAPLLWEIDEVDRVFGRPFSVEVFRLFRAWYNQRPFGDPCWQTLTLVLSYATESRLFIPDEDPESPFNVGESVLLADFTPAEQRELNRRYGSPLKSDEEMERLHALLGGQPFLTRCVLNELVAGGTEFGVVEAAAERGEGLFAEHLSRIGRIVERHAELMVPLRAALEGRACQDGRAFRRLEAVGVVAGTPESPRMRCGLYTRHFQPRLR
ncbi:MAG: serine/threonine-protein kinase [Limisphaerales bacterium]